MQNAWDDFPEWKKITDEDIKQIIGWDNDNKVADHFFPKHSQKSDDARTAIIKIFNYETPLNWAVNRAN